MIDYNERYGYEWVKHLIAFCSDPFGTSDPRRRSSPQDRAGLVLARLVDYERERGIIGRDETIRKQFIDSLVEGIKVDYYDTKTEDHFNGVRGYIEIIINPYK
jgi:hypothetical protein